MKLKINNVRISLLHEVSLEKALSKKIGVTADALKDIRIVRKAVDARKKQDVCINYHMEAEVDLPGKLVNRLLKDKDVSKAEKKLRLHPKLGQIPIACPSYCNWCRSCRSCGSAAAC